MCVVKLQDVKVVNLNLECVGYIQAIEMEIKLEMDACYFISKCFETRSIEFRVENLLTAV